MKDFYLDLFDATKNKKIWYCYLPRKANIVEVFKRGTKKIQKGLEKGERGNTLFKC